MFAYRTSEHSSTKETPFLLMFGRDALHPLDLSFTAPPISTIDTPTYPDKLLVNLPFGWNLAKEHIKKSASKMKENYDKNLKLENLKVGEKVLITNHQVKIGLSPKLAPKYLGPFRILQTTDTNLLIRSIENARKAPFWIHKNRTKRFFQVSDQAEVSIDKNDKQEDEE